MCISVPLDGERKFGKAAAEALHPAAIGRSELDLLLQVPHRLRAQPIRPPNDRPLHAVEVVERAAVPREPLILQAEEAPPHQDVLEILEDRYGLGATIVTSQLPVEQWHDVVGDPTLADAILDRLVHNAHRLELKGASLRKRMAAKAGAETP